MDSYRIHSFKTDKTRIKQIEERRTVKEKKEKSKGRKKHKKAKKKQRESKTEWIGEKLVR